MTPTLDYSSGPDWNANSEAVLCPMCDYNLRGISEPRCPECGFAFKWEELLDPVRRRHRFLLEQQQFHRVRAFRKTLIAGLRPGRFWRDDVQPVHPSHPARLVVYWLMGTAIGIVGTILATGGISVAFAYQVYSFRARLIRFSPMNAVTLGASDAVWPCATLIAWPLATIAALMVFRISLRQAKLRSHHIVRCVFYSADCVVWIGLMLATLAIGSAALTLLLGRQMVALLDFFGFYPINFSLLLMALCGLIFTYRLARAYQLYMRFDHPWLTVLASQIIVGLAWLTVYFNVIAPPRF